MSVPDSTSRRRFDAAFKLAVMERFFLNLTMKRL